MHNSLVSSFRSITIPILFYLAVFSVLAGDEGSYDQRRASFDQSLTRGGTLSVLGRR